jgi:hypothetical protein
LATLPNPDSRGPLVSRQMTISHDGSGPPPTRPHRGNLRPQLEPSDRMRSPARPVRAHPDHPAARRRGHRRGLLRHGQTNALGGRPESPATHTCLHRRQRSRGHRIAGVRAEECRPGSADRRAGTIAPGCAIARKREPSRKSGSSLLLARSGSGRATSIACSTDLSSRTGRTFDHGMSGRRRLLVRAAPSSVSCLPALVRSHPH